MRGPISLEEDDLKTYAAVKVDWEAVINEAVDGAAGLVSMVLAMKSADEPHDKIGLAVYERVSLNKVAVEMKLEGH
jgi:hypothetical protein